MDGNQPNRPRRWVLEVAGVASTIGSAGCFGGEEAGGGDEEDSDQDDEAAQECLEELAGQVPEEYETVESVDGIERDPDDLATKEEAGYQCYPSRYALCANCQYLIESQGEHRMRACTEVEGQVASQHWCVYYAPAERVGDDPDPLPHD